jgi:paraquat-inducible protein A
MQMLPVLSRRQAAECRRCDATLAGPATGRVTAPLAFTLAALLLLIPASVWPLMTVSTLGAERRSWLETGVTALWSGGFPSLAALVGVFSVVLPCVYLGLLVWVLGALYLGRAGPLGTLFRWAKHLRPWMMIEVYLVGCFVAYSRIKVVSSIDIGTGGWCLLAAALVFLFSLTQLDERTVWKALPIQSDGRKGTRTIACTLCDLIVAATEEGRDCPRCAATLHVRKPDAIKRTAALVIAGFFLYVPANVLPVLTTVRLGRADENTILSGVSELIQNHLWPLAIIVFVASIILPLLKLCGLTWMLFATHWRSGRLLVGRTRFYRMIDLVGRWSNIDVFTVSVLIAALRFGTLTEVHAGDGLVAFAAVVVITMLATSVFDPRLMWDASDRQPGESA